VGEVGLREGHNLYTLEAASPSNLVNASKKKDWRDIYTQQKKKEEGREVDN